MYYLSQSIQLTLTISVKTAGQGLLGQSNYLYRILSIRVISQNSFDLKYMIKIVFYLILVIGIMFKIVP